MERKFYENPDYWNPNLYVGAEELRRQTTMKWIPEDVRTICDVGCGNGTLTNYLNDTYFSVGIDRSLAALRWVRKHRCQMDVASLSFAENAFDMVISTEVIEHLPYHLYIRGLSEIVRIARRYIMISVPYCEDLTIKRSKCPHCGCRFHATYHMRSYNREHMENLFSRWTGVELVRAEGIVIENNFLFQRAPYLVRSFVQGAGYPFPKTGLCPQCGYTYGQDDKAIQENSRLLTANSPYLSLIKQLWPKQKRPHWWIALYEKRN